MLKIKIEHGDQGVASAVAGIIENALTQHGFTNVKGKMVMVHQKPKAEAYFTRVSQITPLVSNTELRPDGYSTVLLEARIAFGYPVMVDWMKGDRPDVFAKPVFIDTGIEAAPFEEQLKAFKEGTDKV